MIPPLQQAKVAIQDLSLVPLMMIQRVVNGLNIKPWKYGWIPTILSLNPNGSGGIYVITSTLRVISKISLRSMILMKDYIQYCPFESVINTGGI